MRTRVPLILQLVLLAIVALLACLAAMPVFAAEAPVAVPTLGDQLMQKVVPVLIEALAAAILILLAVWKLKAPQLIAAATDNQYRQAALGYASSLVRALVHRAQATIVDDLKQALADGKITREEYEATLTKLKADILDEVFVQTVGRFKGAGVLEGEVRRIIDAKIEAEVPTAKTAVAMAQQAPYRLPGHPRLPTP